MVGSGLLVIFTEGDLERGLGHVSRCSAYAQGWHERGGQVRWVLDGDDAAERMTGAAASAVRRARWQDGADLAPAELQAEMALVDTYCATDEGLEGIAATAGVTIFIDDLRRAYPAGLVVHAAPDLAPQTSGGSWLEGPGWQPLRRPFWDIEPRGSVGPDVDRVLVVIGGGDVRAIGVAMAELASEVYREARVDLVLAPGQAEPELSPRLTVHRSLDAAAMATLMQQADVAISGAGQTVFELARCGTPTLMIGIADNQQANLDHWPDLCGFINAGHWDDEVLAERVRAGLASLKPDAVRQNISDRAAAIVDGQGVRRLFDRLTRMREG
ncbi:MAG: putative glycosyltransferase [Brevundimonas sp.]|nr:putative glycosyltransferase [Brevundimonas sp.]